MTEDTLLSHPSPILIPGCTTTLEILPTVAIAEQGVEPGGVLQVTCLTQLWPSPSNALLSLTLGVVTNQGANPAGAEKNSTESVNRTNTAAAGGGFSATDSSQRAVNGEQSEKATTAHVTGSTGNENNVSSIFAQVPQPGPNVMTRTALAELVPLVSNRRGRFLPRVKASPALRRNRNITASAQVSYIQIYVYLYIWWWWWWLFPRVRGFCGKCSTIHSPPELLFFFFKFRLARTN